MPDQMVKDMSEKNRRQIMGALRSMAWATQKLHEILIFPENFAAPGCDEHYKVAFSELMHATAQLRPVRFHPDTAPPQS